MLNEVVRGWYVTDQEGTVLKQCANCEDFGTCEKNPNWKYKVCKDYKKLTREGEADE